MSNSVKAKETYDKSVEELNQVLASFTATPEQKAAAQEALTALATKYGAAVIDEVNSRTALLNSLVDELNNVIAKIEANPIGDTIDKFNDLVQTAKGIIEHDSTDL